MLALYGVSLHALGFGGYDQSITGEWKRKSDAIIKNQVKG